MALLRSITKSWLTINPETGSGNGTVAFTASQHTGRTQRSQAFTVASTGTESISDTANQAGKPEFVDVEAAKAATKEGGNVTITGKSNSSKLTVSLGTGTLAIAVPANITVASASVPNGTAITGDPGATAEYEFSMVIAVPANTTLESPSKQIIVTTDGGQTDTCVLTQAAGDPYLRMTPTTINLTWEGTAVTANIEANGDWTIS